MKRHNLADSVVALDASAIDVLYYYVFDRSLAGYPTVHIITQDSTFCDQFGIITDSLPAGQIPLIPMGDSTGRIFSFTGRKSTLRLHLPATM